MADVQPQYPPQWLADLTHQWGPPLRYDIDPPLATWLQATGGGAQREKWSWHRDSTGYLVQLDWLEPSRLNEAGHAARWQVTLQSFGAVDAMQMLSFSTAQAARPDGLVHEALAMAGWLIHPATGTPAAKCTGCGGEREYNGPVPGGASGHHKAGCPMMDATDGLPMWLGIGAHAYELGLAEIGLVEYAAPRAWLPPLLHDIADRIDKAWEQQVADAGGDEQEERL
jgi:hypothetical protein